MSIPLVKGMPQFGKGLSLTQACQQLTEGSPVVKEVAVQVLGWEGRFLRN